MLQILIFCDERDIHHLASFLDIFTLAGRFKQRQTAMLNGVIGKKFILFLSRSGLSVVGTDGRW